MSGREKKGGMYIYSEVRVSNNYSVNKTVMSGEGEW